MAEKEYIEREAAIAETRKPRLTDAELRRRLANIPAADVVSRDAYDQTDWERCVALIQLNEIGKSLGERMDDVRPVVFCRDCKHKGWVQEPEHGKSVDYCRLIERCVDKQFFCAAGERKTNYGVNREEEDE